MDGLTDDQKTSTQFTVHSTEWRMWSNIDSYERQGVSLAYLTDNQKTLGTALLKFRAQRGRPGDHREDPPDQPGGG
ncbi:DUF3500 domain-containing protein [Streptomyces sp. PSKA01]|uniref:DUF3500 domain-containing protein n=1 Tax=Streptomyces cupreus TaxID=2759956 RepID=A0A7X1J9J6_9ACTN|nr:DUF3500 domain-containing protein [Streptomyces cupreus]